MSEQSTKVVIPPPATFRGEEPKQAALVARQERLLSSRRSNIARIKELEEAHYSISEELGSDLQAMQAHGKELDAVQQRESEKGLMAALARTFNRRSLVLQRRSVTEDLVRKYEAVNRVLSRASVFADELQLVALDLRDQIDQLHGQLANDRENMRSSAERVLEIESQLARLDGDHGLGDAVAARFRDQLDYEERAESGRLALLRASVAMASDELAPARAYRDTAQEMHQQMSELVLKVGGAVRGSGRQIEVLGMAGDAPMVVAELVESMADLDRAMVATERYIEHARELFTHTVPALSQEVERAHGVQSLLMVDDLEELSREQARAMADRALLEAAEAEVDGLEKTL
jgi:hypothetical protein